MDNGQ
jgi:hypothetical protein